MQVRWIENERSSAHIISSIAVLVALLLPLINLTSSSISRTVERRYVIERIQSEPQDRSLGKRHIDGLDTNKCGKVPDEGWSSTQAYCNKTVKSTIKYRISEGSNRFPSYVQLQVLNGSLEIPVNQCGGTIISNDLILTTAECVSPVIRANGLELKIGVTSIMIVAFESEGQKQVRFAKVFCRNPYFKRMSVNSSDSSIDYVTNNLALVQTYEGFDYNDYVQPACLNHHSIHKADAECYIAGLDGYLPVKRGCNFDKIKNDYNARYGRLAKGSTCYSRADESKTGKACPGDTGGPLYCMDRCDNGLRQYVVGPVSPINSTFVFGEQCSDSGDKNQPTFITDLSKMPKMVDALLEGCHLDT